MVAGAADRSYAGIDGLGVFEPAAAAWRFSNSPTAPSIDHTAAGFGLGSPAGTPTAGDWDGDGVDGVGIYSGIGHFLSNSAPGATTNVVMGGYGLGGASPPDNGIAGDWNGNGTDTVGMLGGNATFFLNVGTSAAPASQIIGYGLAADNPIWGIAGDWDGDGIDTIGFLDLDTETFYLADANPPTANVFIGGIPGVGVTGTKIPVAGDWDGDGTDGIGLFEPATDTWYLSNSPLAPSLDHTVAFGFGSSTQLPVAGQWVPQPITPSFEVNLDLGLLPTTTTTNRLDITLSIGSATDSELTRVSGNALASIRYEIFDNQPLITSIEFTGGTLNVHGAETDDVAFDLNALGINVDIDGSNLTGQLDTPTPPSTVMDGEFNSLDHVLLVDSGSLVANGTVTFVVPISESIDLDQNPIVLQSDGTAEIDLVLISISEQERTYEVTLALQVDAYYTAPVNDGASVDVHVVGTLIAQDSFSIELPLEGDLDEDGDVDGHDLLVWQRNPSLGDLADWKANYGLPLATTVALVPEPTAFLLASVGFVSVVRIAANTNSHCSHQSNT